MALVTGLAGVQDLEAEHEDGGHLAGVDRLDGADRRVLGVAALVLEQLLGLEAQDVASSRKKDTQRNITCTCLTSQPCRVKVIR